MPAAQTYEPIATQTLGSATNLITFSSISQAYTDLILVVDAAVATGQDMYFRLNGDSGTNYSWTILYGTGTTPGTTRSGSNTLGMADYYGAPRTTLGTSVQILHFMNYSSTATNKTIFVRSNNADTGTGTDILTNLWRSTSAITSIELRMSPSATINFSIGSMFTLYGIKAA